jgi:malate/lactate dehydrogenase
MAKKVTVVGAGFYGSTTALRLAEYNIFDTVVLTDILEGKPEGLALDINLARSRALKPKLLVQLQQPMAGDTKRQQIQM